MSKKMDLDRNRKEFFAALDAAVAAAKPKPVPPTVHTDGIRVKVVSQSDWETARRKALGN